MKLTETKQRVLVLLEGVTLGLLIAVTLKELNLLIFTL